MSPAEIRSERGSKGLWGRAERLVEAHLDDVPGLIAQGVGPLAARILEARGEAPPSLLAQQARFTRLALATAPAVLERVRAACDGPLVLVKGPEVATRYPGKARIFLDLDLLVLDAARVQRSLLAAGFVEEEDPEGLYVDIHHLTPLRWPGTLLTIEVHSEPKWPQGLEPPTILEIVDQSVESSLGVEGVRAPESPVHAVLLAAHAWAHQPLASMRDLLDFGALCAESDDEAVRRLARRWGVSRLVATTTAALDAALGGRRTLPLRLWAGHLAQLRGQMVVEQHLERLLSPFWGLPPRPALVRASRALSMEFRPAFDETWGEKLSRTGRALRRALVPVASHNRQLGQSAVRGRRRNRPRGERGETD